MGAFRARAPSLPNVSVPIALWVLATLSLVQGIVIYKCENTCPGKNTDWFCDDGGPGSFMPQTCDLGTDCDDCGPRRVEIMIETAEPTTAPTTEGGGGNANEVCETITVGKCHQD